VSVVASFYLFYEMATSQISKTLLVSIHFDRSYLWEFVWVKHDRMLVL
jgi:hypothetical protein